MAKVTGPDVLTVVMSSMAQLQREVREDSEATRKFASRMEEQLQLMQSHARRMGEQFQLYGKRAGERAERMERNLATVGRALGRVATETQARLKDHERRIAALESR